jgi:hypothetical protein
MEENNHSVTHPMVCPACDEIVEAVDTDAFSPAIIRCPACGYSDINQDLNE